MDETNTTAGASTASTAPVAAETPETPVVTPETSEVVEVVPAEIEMVPVVQPESSESLESPESHVSHVIHDSVGESTVSDLPVLDATGAIPVVTEPASVSDLPIIDPTNYSPNESATKFSRPEGDENGSTPVVNSTSPSPTSTEAPQPTERVVERVVEKEVIKEVPKEVIVEKIVEKIVEVEKVVEKIVEKPVEKIVYRDREPAPQVCPPPTQEEIEAIKRDFLLEMSKQGTAKRDEIMALKTDLIMSLFDTKSSITHKDVMEDLDFPSTTATRLLTLLRHEGKITLHGTSPHTFTYTKN